MPYCTNCGAEVEENAQYCPNCGRAQRPVAHQGMAGPARQRGEKTEKQEKQEKGEKGERNEKGEKDQDGAGPLTGGLVLIWLGITFFLATSNYITWSLWWAYFLLGLGIIFLLRATIVYASNKRKGLVIGPAIAGTVMIVVGLASILNVTNWWWLIPIALGIGIVVMALRERSQNPRP
ncbi:zinc-ribbon domain-containing protein [Candidatus Bathyarchaeota archaeon]|nr:zinc-ribbon domain-containing protein [Candidatus Bathyarchaeota archaeon]